MTTKKSNFALFIVVDT